MPLDAIGVLIAMAGVWIFQDGLASILYYCGRANESWHFNQTLRLIRCAWGLLLIVLGLFLIL